MAKRRMFSIPLMEADSFYELSALSQALYFHLNLNADDDGLVDNVKSVMRDLKASKNNLAQLTDGGYLIELDKKVFAITHWNQHNRIKSDRYTKTTYGELMSNLRRDENDRYFKASEVIFGDICAPQDSVVKDSTVEYSKAKDSVAEHRAEEERKNITFSLSYKQPSVASLSEQQKNENTFFPDKNVQTGLKTLIKLYFMKNYNIEYSDEFIRFCEKGDWEIDGCPVIASSYKKQIDEWMAKK